MAKSAVSEGRFGVAVSTGSVSTGFRFTDVGSGRTMELYLYSEGNPVDGPEQSFGFFAPAGEATVTCSYCQKRHPVVEFADAARRSYIVTANTGATNLDAICMSSNQIADAIYEASRPRPLKGARRPQAVRPQA